MHQTRKLLLAIFISIAGFTSNLPAAFAQDETLPGGVQFFVTP
jgi:hypothetical protein